MSDFLSRLAGRTLGLAPVVQPAIPAMTDPGSGAETGFVEREIFRDAAEGPAETRREPTVQGPATADTSRASLASPIPYTRREKIAEPAAETQPGARAVTLPPPEGADESTRTRPDTPLNLTDRDALTLPSWDSNRLPPALRPAESIAPKRVNAGQAEPPTIRVTIGRVEVRAEFSSPKVRHAPAARSKPAALSLDDYLKQRSEGRR